MKAPRRILLVKPSSMGDVIHALPVVGAIHRNWPDSELRWLIHPAWRSLVESHPGVSGTVLFPREKFRGFTGLLRSVKWMGVLKDWKPDLAIDLQGLMRSAVFCRVSGAARVIGLSDAREGAGILHGEHVPVKRRDHAVTRYLEVIGHLGISGNGRPDFFLPEGRLPAGFDPKTRYVVLHPFARGEGKSLGESLVRSFTRGVSGSPSTKLIIVGRSGGRTFRGLPSFVEDWSDRTDLPELIGILRGAAFVVSSDSGPMHLAAALRPSRTLAIHLWSDPLKVGPFFPESYVWKNGLIRRVNELEDSSRPAGRPPSESEMEWIGRFAAEDRG
jgi:heptosyltransferase I